MSRRRAPWYLVLVVILAALTHIAPAAASSQRDAARVRRFPNVLVIVADDQPLGSMRAMPRIRREIFDRGVEFSRAYVTTPVCCPSRSSILTGGLSHTTGVYTNRNDRDGGFAAFHRNGGEQRTMAFHLDDTYQTALFGKYLNGYQRYAEDVLQRPRYVPPGWDEWQAFYRKNGAYYDYSLNVNGTLQAFESEPADYSTDVLGERLLDWLTVADGDGRDPDEPFFAYFAPFAPHGPAAASPLDAGDPRFLDLPRMVSPALNEGNVSDKPRYIRRQERFDGADLGRIQRFRIRQHQALFALDRQVGRIMDLLETTGLIDDTIVVYLSDNGEAWGEHRWNTKLVPYDRVIHVPFAIRYDRLDRGAHVERQQLVMNTDVLPTIMRLTLGRTWSAPHPVDGRSLRGAIRGTLRRPLRSHVLLENLYLPRPARAGGAVPSYCGVVTRSWKYVVYGPEPAEPGLVAPPFEEELYDLAADPYELVNVAPERPAVVQRLRARLQAMCDPPPPRWTAW